MKEQLIALFGGAKPTVRQYHELLKCMPLEERGIFFDRTFGLALSGWMDLTVPYRLFLVRLIRTDRQRFVDYIRQKTVLGEFLYGMEELNLFLKVLNLWMQPYKNHKSSYTAISFSLLLAFDIDVSVKYLADKIRYSRMDSYDFAEFLEKSCEME
ncbi:MAG: hypothetical protein LUH63_21145 [Parabacteroides sp.]|uniref:hypothetical protein n=1 Tax=uncultured Parabacteroides sp. TaxID=512312 RepID=UPI0025CE2DD8|nr:hypothetical protein [uncultured Parabacteroides sp.]MCD7852004.1 hypothetical protein [Parabacteroides sp.]